MGLHVAAGHHVAVDRHVSRAVHSLHRKASQCTREASASGLSDPRSNSDQRAGPDSGPEIELDALFWSNDSRLHWRKEFSPRSGRTKIAQRFIAGKVTLISLQSAKRTADMFRSMSKKFSVARFTGLNSLLA